MAGPAVEDVVHTLGLRHLEVGHHLEGQPVQAPLHQSVHHHLGRQSLEPEKGVVDWSVLCYLHLTPTVQPPAKQYQTLALTAQWSQELQRLSRRSALAVSGRRS